MMNKNEVKFFFYLLDVLNDWNACYLRAVSSGK